MKTSGRAFFVCVAAVCAVAGAFADSPVFTNDGIRLEFDARGRISSLRELGSGRELVRKASPFVSVSLADGRREQPLSFRYDGNSLSYSFPSGGELSFAITPFGGGWMFTFSGCTRLEAREVVACDIWPSCTNYVGALANMASDDTSGVCLRACDIDLQMLADRPARLWVRTAGPFVGRRFCLAAGPRAELARKLRSMTVAAGVPVNECGGAWSLGAEANRGSYLQPVMEAAAVDRWIDLAERGGFTTIHLRRWMETLGHYEPKRSLYPNGWDDLFAAVRKIKAAGLKAGIHTLTGCISPEDSWVASDLNRYLIPWCTYTLKADLPPDADVFEVVEAPKMVHDTSLTYFGNGNAFRIGSEIVQYSGFTKSPPYRYTGLKRGAFGTKAAAHAAGEKADYLQQRYIAFYPEPDSPLADALVERIAWFVDKGGFDQIYFDGAEGMMTRQRTDLMRRRIFSAIGRSLVVEASCQSPHSWWQHSRGGAWDGANFDFKPFVDLHVRSTMPSRKTDLMETQMGWWLFRDQWLQRRGQFTDDIEYFASRNAGWDSAMSFMEVDVNKGPLSLYRENAVTMLGRYERFRLAKAFREDVLEGFRTPGREFRLRQDDAGMWRVHPVAFTETHAATGGEPHGWRIDMPEERALEIRIEPLYSNRPFDDARALAIFAPTTNGVAISSAAGVDARIGLERSSHGDAISVKARNRGAPQRGSWVKLARLHAKDLEPRGRRGLGLWVRGDGSGAVVDMQLRMPRTYGGTVADYVFNVDFTGWRYIETSIRERTPSEAMKWTWDEPIRSYTRYLSELNMLHLSEVRVYANNIPAGKDIDIAFGEIRMMDTFDATLADASIEVDGKVERVPFAVNSGEYATREPDGWRHWDVKGNLLAAAPACGLKLGAGVHRLSFAATPPEGSTARVRICTFAVGAGIPALRDDLPPDSYAPMAYEAETACLFDPAKGCTSMVPVRVRPGECAKVEFRFIGPVKGGVLSFDGSRFPVRDLGVNEEYLLKLPGICGGGTHPVSFEAVSGGCRIGAVKRYVRRDVPPADGVLKLSPGVHELSSTVALGCAWSGVTICSSDPERPAVLSGGRRISGWTVGTDGVWRVTLPEVKAGRWNFSTLYVNGCRRTRPSLPATGYFLSVSNAFVEGEASIGGLAFCPGDIPGKIENLSDVELQALHSWCTTRARIGAIDVEGGLLRFASPRKSTQRFFDFSRRRFRLENVKEVFSADGTWYLDRPSGVLAYRPVPGETPETAEVIAPLLETLLRVEGADGIRFENVEFSHQNLVTPDSGRFAVQAGWNIPAAVEVVDANAVAFDRCLFRHTDGYALEISEGASGTLVDESVFRDLGAGGIRIGGFTRNGAASGTGGGSTVRRCRITDGGNVFPDGVGVLIGRSSRNTVVSNEIDHIRYTGVSVGWDWDSRRPSKAHHNEIAYNHIHDIGLGLLSDMGMIYLLGRSPGTTVHDNNLHDITCFDYGGIGIYPDQGTSEVRIWNNIVRNTTRGYHQNYGEDNEVFNNIFVNAGRCQWDCRPQKGTAGPSVRMHHNIFVWKEGVFFRREWPFGMTSRERAEWGGPLWQGFTSDSNVLWRVDGRTPDFCGMGVDEWREKSGHERGSFVGDPKFSGDVFSGDCRLPPDSPAVRLGFKPL